MLKSLRLLTGLTLGLVICVLDARIGLAEEPKAILARDEFEHDFGLTRIWDIHLHVTAEDWKTMQPKRGGMPAFGPPPPPGGGAGPVGPGPGPGTPAQPFRPGSFGYEFEYVKADVELDGQSVSNVGLRFKGNGSYMVSAGGRKRPYKIDFNRYVDDQRFHGMQQLNLHNDSMDPTHVRQALSYAAFQAAGIPSPRTAFAKVSLTIDGECDREFLGLYTVVEEIDKRFLRRHFESAKGMLLKPKGTQGFEYKGEDWNDYAWFEPQSKPKKSETRLFIDALRLIHKAEDDEFRQKIGNSLDTDQFARFLAANALLANMDSFLTHVHNYYVYLPPETNKFVMLPWDMDLSLGSFFMAGSPEQLQDLSISHPHVGDNKLLDRLLAWDDFNQTYRKHLRDLTQTCFGEDGSTTKGLPIVQAAIKDLVAADLAQATKVREAQGPGGFGPGGFGPGPGRPGMFGSPQSLDVFLVKRRESVLAQLDGTSKGQKPGMGFGPGGRPGGGSGFGPGNFHAPQMLLAGDTNKDQKLSRDELADLGTKWRQQWDLNKNDSLDLDEIKSGMNDSLGQIPGSGANSGTERLRPPPGFGPGTFLGPILLKAADQDNDAAASPKEWTALFAIWFTEWDGNHDDGLDQSELVSGLNKTFGPPQGFGPPGAGPPGARPSPQAAPAQPKADSPLKQ